MKVSAGLSSAGLGLVLFGETVVVEAEIRRSWFCAVQVVLAHGVIECWWQLGEWGYPGFVKGLSKVRWDFSVVLSTFKLPYTEALMRNMKLLESFIIFFEAYTGILCNLWHFLLFIMNFFRWREKQLFPLRVSERKERKKRCCLFFVQLADSADDMPQNQRRLGSN